MRAARLLMVLLLLPILFLAPVTASGNQTDEAGDCEIMTRDYKIFVGINETKCVEIQYNKKVLPLAIWAKTKVDFMPANNLLHFQILPCGDQNISYTEEMNTFQALYLNINLPELTGTCKNKNSIRTLLWSEGGPLNVLIENHGIFEKDNNGFFNISLRTLTKILVGILVVAFILVISWMNYSDHKWEQLVAASVPIAMSELEANVNAYNRTETDIEHGAIYPQTGGYRIGWK